MEYYSAIKKNVILLFVTTWMGFEGIMLSEISQTEKNKYRMLSLTCGILKNKNKQTKKNNQAHRYKEQIGGFQRLEGGERMWAKWVKWVKRYKLPVINKSWGCNVQHSDYN